MKSIVGEYHNAVNTSSGGWAVTDKIFGYLNSLTTDYAKVRTATLQPGDIGYIPPAPKPPFPLGSVLILGGIIVAGVVVYKTLK